MSNENISLIVFVCAVYCVLCAPTCVCLWSELVYVCVCARDCVFYVRIRISHTTPQLLDYACFWRLRGLTVCVYSREGRGEWGEEGVHENSACVRWRARQGWPDGRSLFSSCVFSFFSCCCFYPFSTVLLEFVAVCAVETILTFFFLISKRRKSKTVRRL